MTNEEIMKHFPHQTPRQGQLEAIRFAIEAFKSGKKYVMIEAPTGAGKSAIGVTVSRIMGKSYYLTAQRLLQDQLMTEFGDSGTLGQLMIDLKGRSNYECTWYATNATHARTSGLITQETANEWRAKYFNCAEGYCRKKDKSNLEECLVANSCPYYSRLNSAMKSDICLMNFYSYLYQMFMADRSNQFGKRPLMVIDEAHTAESQLLGFTSITLNSSDLPNVKFPKYDDANEYIQWFIDDKILERLSTIRAVAKSAEDLRKFDELNTLIAKISVFMNEASERLWVVEHSYDINKNLKLTFKPVFIDKQADKLLFSMADHFLMMSATILNAKVMAEALGLDIKDVATLRMDSTFPSKNRPIYYKPVAKITGGQGQVDVWGPKLVEGVNKIVNHHKNVRGIIHTHNFAIAKLLLNECDDDVRLRFLFQENFVDKNEMLMVHANRKDSVIVAPAMHEGVDLHDDLSRFQIITKVPFPNFYEDKQLNARMEIDGAYYDWKVAQKLVQSVGRSVRSDTDWALTYIIDGAYANWHKNNVSMLPKWYKEAVIGL